MTTVLPKAASSVLTLTLELAAKRGTIDASTALALSSLLSDKQFAIEFKTKMADTRASQKEQRAINKEAKLQKKTVSDLVVNDEHQASPTTAKSGEENDSGSDAD
jgi:hypothetical protein